MTINNDVASLEARIQDLEKADTAKDHFLALLSHELRNHIHAIRTNVWLIKARNRDLEIARPGDAIDRQVVKLSRLVEDLMDVIRVTQKSALSFETVTLQQVVGSAVATQESADSHRREVSVEMPDNPIYVSADAARLQQAIGNLLHNAIKYSPQQGEICIRATESDGRATVSVKDCGIGLSAAQMKNIFHLFADGLPGRKPGAEGLGIGLHVACQLVEAHGGHLEVKSEGAGKGAEFILQLPVIEPPQAMADAEAAASAAKDDVALSILVVDDNRDAADSLAQVLQAYGHRVTAAYGGEEALDVAGKGNVQVALVDIGMPTVDGFQVAERISHSEAGRDTLLVAVTGWGEKADRTRSKAAGFAYHLTKPVDFDALASLLATAARRAHGQHPARP